MCDMIKKKKFIKVVIYKVLTKADWRTISDEEIRYNIYHKQDVQGLQNVNTERASELC